MLERQHSQLIAGLHEMFKFGQQGRNWPYALLELAHQCEGQHPLTHQILEALGVLQCSPQDEAEDPKGEWRTFEQHPQDDGVFNGSCTPSPTLQNPVLRSWENIKQPTIPYRSASSQQRSFKFERDSQVNGDHTLSITPLNFSDSHSQPVLFHSINMAPFLPHQPLPNPFSREPTYDETMGLGSHAAVAVNWSAVEDISDCNDPFAQPLRDN